MACAALGARRLLAATTAHEGLDAAVKAGRRAYLGIDPTADGLHVGNLAAVMALRQLRAAGARPVALVGGATGLVGDPSGRDSEREMLTEERVAQNVAGLRRDLGRLLDLSPGGDAELVDNLDWMRGMSAIDLLRDVGKHFRVSTMLSRESVRARLERDDAHAGLSFTEFSYQLLQAYDFLHLYRTRDCRIQVGGSDQWGNIVGGIDLIRRVEGKTDAFGATIPLLTTKSGQKFGKSMGNAVWLSPDKTSNYAFYQFFLRQDDEDVEDLLFRLTELEEAEIAQIMERHQQAPHERAAQRALAASVTELVRGQDALRNAQAATNALFGSATDLSGVRGPDLIAVGAAGDAPVARLAADQVIGKQVIEVAIAAGLCKSKGEARRLVKSGGLYLNNQRLAGDAATFGPEDAIDGQAALLRSGKKHYTIVELFRD